MITFSLRYLNASEITIIHLAVKKSTSVRLSATETKNLIFPQIFEHQSLQTKAQSHIINILELKSGDEDIDCTLSFNCRTGCSNFTNVENGLWMLMRELSARGNQSKTKNVVSALAIDEQH